MVHSPDAIRARPGPGPSQDLCLSDGQQGAKDLSSGYAAAGSGMEKRAAVCPHCPCPGSSARKNPMGCAASCTTGQVWTSSTWGRCWLDYWGREGHCGLLVPTQGGAAERGRWGREAHFQPRESSSRPKGAFSNNLCQGRRKARLADVCTAASGAWSRGQGPGTHDFLSSPALPG